MYDTSGMSEKNINYNYNTLQNYQLGWNNLICERTFFENFTKTVYDNLLVTASDFCESQDFIDVMSDIHKDLLEIIRFNILGYN